MTTDDFFINCWQDIVNSIDIIDVPLKYIKQITVETLCNEEIIIYIQDIVEQPKVDIKHLEIIINNKIQQISNNIKCINYMLNIEQISHDIQLTTDTTLKLIK